MSKYNAAYHRDWYLRNRERLLEVRRAYNKEYSNKYLTENNG